MRLNLVLAVVGRKPSGKVRIFNSYQKESGNCSYIGNYERQKVLDPVEYHH